MVVIGNFMEFLPMLSMLKTKYSPRELPYHLIVPSLPGYAFSDPPPLDRDFSNIDIAAIVNQLMIDLGFSDGYIAQGGDVGSRVARGMVNIYEQCKGMFKFQKYNTILLLIQTDSCSSQLFCSLYAIRPALRRNSQFQRHRRLKTWQRISKHRLGICP
jgi:pimeloyl-ACP methyl ester carboxylesterase